MPSESIWSCLQHLATFSIPEQKETIGWPPVFRDMDGWAQAILTALARCTARRDLKRRSGNCDRSLKVLPKGNANQNEERVRMQSKNMRDLFKGGCHADLWHGWWKGGQSVGFGATQFFHNSLSGPHRWQSYMFFLFNHLCFPPLKSCSFWPYGYNSISKVSYLALLHSVEKGWA